MMYWRPKKQTAGNLPPRDSKYEYTTSVLGGYWKWWENYSNGREGTTDTRNDSRVALLRADLHVHVSSSLSSRPAPAHTNAIHT